MYSFITTKDRSISAAEIAGDDINVIITQPPATFQRFGIYHDRAFTLSTVLKRGPRTPLALSIDVRSERFVRTRPQTPISFDGALQTPLDTIELDLSLSRSTSNYN